VYIGIGRARIVPCRNDFITDTGGTGGVDTARYRETRRGAIKTPGRQILIAENFRADLSPGFPSLFSLPSPDSIEIYRDIRELAFRKREATPRANERHAENAFHTWRRDATRA